MDRLAIGCEISHKKASRFVFMSLLKIDCMKSHQKNVDCFRYY